MSLALQPQKLILLAFYFFSEKIVPMKSDISLIVSQYNDSLLYTANRKRYRKRVYIEKITRHAIGVIGGSTKVAGSVQGNIQSDWHSSS